MASQQSSQPPPPPLAIGRRRGHTPAFQPGVQKMKRVGNKFPALPANSPQPPAPPPLTFRPRRLPPAPPRPFVLIPDSAAPAAAAKRTLHFRFRTAPPLSQNRRPSLLMAPPLPPSLPRRRVLPARGVLGTPGGAGPRGPAASSGSVPSR